jgi:glycosyltransferase involved in cell wall biosynthesis
MKIVQATSYFSPEFGYEEYNISRKLVELGHDVSIITSDRIFPFKNVKELLKRIDSQYTTRDRGIGLSKNEGINVYRLPCAFELIADFILLFNLRATLKHIKPDIVHIHEPIQGGIAFIAGHKDLGFKLLVDQHSYATTFDEAKTFKNRVAHYQFLYLRKYFARYAFNRADAITAVTPRTKQFMVDVEGIPEDRIEIVPLGINVGLFNHNSKARIRIRNELNVSPETPMILTAGRIDRAKRYEQLLKAFSEVNKKVDSKLVIMGSGDKEYEQKLHNEVSKLGIKKSVKFIEFVKKDFLSEYYSAADIGFWNKASITILEAMHCKLPVVIPDQDTIKPYVSNNNGLLFKENDIDMLKEQLLSLAKDKKTRENMGIRGKKLVEEKYSYSATTKQYLKIYERLLNE